MIIRIWKKWFGPKTGQVKDTTKKEASPSPMLQRLETYLSGKYDFRFNVLTEQEVFFKCFRLPEEGEKGIQLSATEIFCRIRKRFPAALRRGNVRAMRRILTVMGVPRAHTREGSMYQVVPL